MKILLHIRLWWTDTIFNIKYPVEYTTNLEWIQNYNIYLQNRNKITKMIYELNNK